MVRFLEDKVSSDRWLLWIMLEITSDLIKKSGADAIAEGNIISNVEVAIKTLTENAKRYDMNRTAERIETINGNLSRRNDFPIKLVDWQHQLNELIGALNKDLEDKLLLYVPSEFAEYYNQDDLFGVKNKFPKANEEITLAGNCYATENYTACVFHLMRGVEHGAKAMVKAMNAQKHFFVMVKG